MRNRVAKPTRTVAWTSKPAWWCKEGMKKNGIDSGPLG